MFSLNQITQASVTHLTRCNYCKEPCFSSWTWIVLDIALKKKMAARTDAAALRALTVQLNILSKTEGYSANNCMFKYKQVWSATPRGFLTASLHVSPNLMGGVLYVKLQGPGRKTNPAWIQWWKRLLVHEAATLSYTHMLLLLSSCHLWSGCHHPIHQICQRDRFLLTGHVSGDGICFINSFSVVLILFFSAAGSSLPTQWKFFALRQDNV